MKDENAKVVAFTVVPHSDEEEAQEVEGVEGENAQAESQPEQTSEQTQE